MRAVVVVVGIMVAGAGACGEAPPGDPCGDYVPPPVIAASCDDPTDPHALVACTIGSANAGVWAIDAAGLPAYDFRVDQRCDANARAWSPRPTVQRDPIHVVGDGFGTVAMAHASGGLDVYTQDRGHKWPVRIDTWADPDDPAFPPQLGGAIGYVVDGDALYSTRFEDLPIAGAIATQSRRFGVGYVETVTRAGDLTITRRTYAATGTRALVTETTIANAGRARTVELVDLWDVNLSEIPVELITSDLANPGITRGIERRRRELAAQFTHHAGYDADARVASMATDAIAAPVGPDEPSEVDWYPETLWLAPLDGAVPDAVWLADDELWPGTTDRSPPVATATASGDATSRTRELPGANQPGVLAVRTALELPAGGTATRRVGFGTAPHGADPVAAAIAARTAVPDAATAAAGWRDRLVWAAFPGQPGAGALQRELAWSSYHLSALATVDEYRGMRVLGQGGSYKYIHGLDGAMGDLAIFAEALTPIDPALAADTLAYAFATQHGPDDATPWRFPYATTGVGSYSDVVRYTKRSDVYFLLPAEVARYVALTRDAGFLDRDVPYWPRSAGATGTVLDHLARTEQFARDQLGIAARGLVAMGTGDYADGVLQTATEPATPTGTSSTYNAGFVVTGFGLLADVIGPRDAALAADVADLRASQAAALEAGAWNGMWYERGFVDSGNPLGSDNLYLEPQILPILAGLVSPERRAALLDLIGDRLETPIGAMSTIALAAGGTGDIDRPQVNGVWPVANAWLTEAYALEDPARGWDSLIRNTLFTHAEQYPGLWYGTWTGPDSYFGPDAERPGEADAHLATALTDYPALNAHAHTSTLRALFGVLGIRGEADGITIAPHVPTERFAVVWPMLSLDSAPDRIAGTLTPTGGGSLVLRVALPSGLRTGTLRVVVDGATATFTRIGDTVAIDTTATAGAILTWSIDRAPG